MLPFLETFSNQAANAIASQLLRLEQSQWFSPEKLREMQLRQLGLVLKQAISYSPYYRKRFSVEKRTSFRELPLLTRSDLQNFNEEITCQKLPKNHLPYSILQTSGSTGQTVSVKRTSLTNLVWMANTLRDHLWHKRDFSKN